MKLTHLLRGPSTSTVEAGPAASVDRVVTSRFYRPIKKVTIGYTPVTLRRVFFFPWQQARVAEIWNLEITCHLSDGRSFTHASVSQAPLELALNYGYLEGIRKTMAILHKQATALAA